MHVVADPRFSWIHDSLLPLGSGGPVISKRLVKLGIVDIIMFLEYDREYKVKLVRLKFKSIVYLSCEKCLKEQEGEIKNIYEICMNIFTVTKISTLNMAEFLDLSLHCDEFVL